MNYQRTLGSIITFFLFISAGILSAQQPSEEFQDLYQEYMAISQQLQATHQMVMQDPEIVQQSEDFSKYIDQKLKELSPEVSTLVDERNEMIKSIESAREIGDIDTEHELQPRFQQLNQSLEPHIYEVLEDDQVQVRQQVLDAVFMAKMNEIDPETDEKIARLELITEQLQKMME